jgi:hypothetical protein
MMRPPSGSLINVKTRQLTQVDTQDGAAKPRLCVSLDYLANMSMDPKKRIAPPLFFEDPQSIYREAKGHDKPIIPASFNLYLSEQLLALDCIESLRLWIFEGGGQDAKRKDIPKVWHPLPLVLPDLSPASLQKNGQITMRTRTPLSLDALPAECRRYGRLPVSFAKDAATTLQRVLNAAERPIRAPADRINAVHAQVRQAFCEVQLKAPKTDWARDMNCSDPWFFPIDVGIRRSNDSATLAGEDDYAIGFTRADRYRFFVNRRSGEFGEVPDWGFWAKYYGEKQGGDFPVIGDVIRPFGTLKEGKK